MNDYEKRSWAEVSFDNLRHNYRAIRNEIGQGCRFLGVVKADAYGHGALPVAQLLESLGADYLAVSCLDEALELRQGGITLPLLILGHTPPQYTGCLIDNHLTQTVSCLAKAREYSAAAVALGKSLSIHLKLDTGMSRLGFLCAGGYEEEGVRNIAESCLLPGLKPEGIYTHMAVSDEAAEDCRAYTEEQFALFTRVVARVEERIGFRIPLHHCANSGCVVNHPHMDLDLVRPGLLLYGYGDPTGRLGLKPCMSLKSAVSTIKFYEPGTSVSYGRRFVTDRRTRMGVLPIGYADGLHRLLSNRCSFAAKGGKAPQRGSICMDMCMVDLTELPQADVGSAVEIFGEENPLEELAAIAQTIPYELLCAVSRRIPRVYK